MITKSKFDIEEDSLNQRNRYIQGGCGARNSMISELTHLDVGTLHMPKFIQKILHVLGWETEARKKTE